MATKKTKWGIWGTGKIAQDFVTVLSYLPDAEVVAVGSRTKEAAEEFGKKFNIPRRYVTADLVKDQEVEVIYVTTLHTHHYESTLKCLRAGKAVLCEKPIAMDARQAQEMVRVAREKKVFLMEAMWTRFFPSVIKAREIIASGQLGKIVLAQGDFGFFDDKIPRLQQKELGGGALLDIGIYPLSFISMVFGGKTPERISALGTLLPTGVDGQVTANLKYSESQLGSMYCTIRSHSPKEFRILGEKGSLFIHAPFWCPTKLTLTLNDQPPQDLEFPLPAKKENHNFIFTNSIGLQYEAAHVQQCLREGKLESPVISLNESVLIMKTMDEIRKQIGLTYPSDEY